jgi:deferrochelatase/peroxidase EfeB
MTKENEKPNPPNKYKIVSSSNQAEILKPTPKNLIIKLLKSRSIEDLKLLLTYLSNFEKSQQEEFAVTFELKALAFGSVVKITQKIIELEKETKLKNTDKQIQNQIDEYQKVLNDIYSFFNLSPK